jgi:aminopeptidase N
MNFLRFSIPLLACLPLHAEEIQDSIGHCGKQLLWPDFGGDGKPGRKYARDRLVDIEHLAIDVIPDFKGRSIRGEVTIAFQPIAEALPRLELDCVDLVIDAVGAAGAKVASHRTTRDKLVLEFAEPVPAGTRVAVSVRYHGEPAHGIYFRTPEMGYPDGDTQLWTQGEAENHRFWFPCYDYPNERFTTEVTCHVPEGMETISNGVLLSKEKDAAGLTAWRWKQDKPHVNYLIALAAGHFHKLESKAGELPLALFVPPSEKDQAELAFRDTAKIIEFFQKETGTPFPWDKYYQVYCHDFLAGGMENTSCTFNAASALFPAAVGELDTLHRLDAHETAHQWFGDLITCRDWSHLWLNEGFASYYTVLYEEQRHGREGFLLSLWREAQRVLNSNDTRPIVWRDYLQPMEQFDSRAYPKGAWVLHMLRSQLGPDLYRTAIRRYIETHRNGIVTTDDLQDVFEQVSGRSFDQFFDQWVHHGGAPDLKVDYAWDNAAQLARLTVRQTQKVDEKVPLFRFPLPVRFHLKTADGKEETRDFTVTVSKAEEDFSFSLPSQPELVRIDPDLTVLAKLEFNPPGDMLKRQLQSDFMGRLRAIEAFGKRRDAEAVALLATALKEDGHHALRTEAARGLGRAGTPESRKALAEATGIADERVRRAVVDALADNWHPEAVAALAALAPQEKNPIILSAIVRSFAAWPAQNLLPFVGTPSYHNMVAAAAIAALKSQERTDAAPAIIEFIRSKAGTLESNDLGAALEAVASLSRESKDDTVQPFLAEYLRSPRRGVAAAAARALGTLGDTRSLPLLRAAAGVKNDAATASAADAALASLQAKASPQAQTLEAWKKVEALQRKTEELEKKLEKLQEKDKPAAK